MPPPGFAAPPPSERPAVRRVPRTHAPGFLSKRLAVAVLLVAGAAVALLLIGSGGGQIDGPIARAATLSSKTDGYRMRTSLELSSSALGAQITAAGRGVVDLRGQTSSMSLELNLGGQQQLVQQLGSSTLRMELISDHAVLYIKLPPAVMTALPTGGRQWIKADLSKLSHVPGFSSLASNPGLSDPADVLESLRSLSAQVVTVGQEQVGRVHTTHYRAELALGDFVKRFSQGDSAAEKALSTLPQNVLPSQIPMDVWIDGSGLLRRIEMTLDLNLPGGASMHEAVTLDFSDYGAQRAPLIPSPEQVVDVSSLSSAGG